MGGRPVAVTVAAWLLMLPPNTGLQGRRLRFEPLGQWKTIDKFSSRTECERMRSELVQRMPNSAINTARCVSEDDPALSPNPEPKIG